MATRTRVAGLRELAQLWRSLPAECWCGWRASHLSRAPSGHRGEIGKPSATTRERIDKVKPNPSHPPSTVIAVLVYPDARQAVSWPSAAFGPGFTLRVVR